MRPLHVSATPLDRRPAAVAGLFYPEAPGELAREVDALLMYASQRGRRAAALPKALIVPHAGYVYSGRTAGAGYAALCRHGVGGGSDREKGGGVRRVVLLGPAHRVPVRGIAVPTVACFSTPLGDVPLDRRAIDALLDLPQVVASDVAHAHEHALEVQLPFLQRCLGSGFVLVPLVVGDVREDALAAVLERLWGGPETVVIVSSDLSHYHSYREAQAIDAATADDILAARPLSSHDQACGAGPINGLLAVARRKGLRIERLAQCTSGDTAGDKERVVGYAAFAFYAREPAPTGDARPAGDTSCGKDPLGACLLAQARAAIAQAVGRAVATPSTPAATDLMTTTLHAPGASFVTLTQDGALRGCIGSLEAHRPLLEDVRANALAAALHDPRFVPLRADELDRTRIEVSVLSSPVALCCTDEADALRQLRPGVDGLILDATDAGARRATFLPQVWDQLPAPADFMAHLKQKAGLPADGWSHLWRLARYTVTKWKEAP